MKVGDKVRLIAIPPDVRDQDDMPTRSLFEKCIGQEFRIADIESVEGLNHPLIKLNLPHPEGARGTFDVIWVEPRYLKLEEPE